MKGKYNVKAAFQGILAGLMILGVCLAAKAQPINKKYSKTLSKLENALKTSQIDFRGGKLVVSGEVRQVDVSGGNDGCYTMTVNVYKIAPNGEKILVRTRSKKVCAVIDLPKFVFEDIPLSKVIVEIGIDKPDWREEKFKVDLNVEGINR